MTHLKIASPCSVNVFKSGNSSSSGVPRNILQGWGVQQIQLRTERTGSGGGSSLVRVSEGNYNLVQEISFHIVKFS